MLPATISSDLPCVVCGYNLRTLHVASRCPECGADVALSRSSVPPATIQQLRAVRQAVGTLCVAIAWAAVTAALTSVLPRTAAISIGSVPGGLSLPALVALWGMAAGVHRSPRRQRRV